MSGYCLSCIHNEVCMYKLDLFNLMKSPIPIRKDEFDKTKQIFEVCIKCKYYVSNQKEEYTQTEPKKPRVLTREELIKYNQALAEMLENESSKWDNHDVILTTNNEVNT